MQSEQNTPENINKSAKSVSVAELKINTPVDHERNDNILDNEFIGLNRGAKCKQVEFVKNPYTNIRSLPPCKNELFMLQNKVNNLDTIVKNTIDAYRSDQHQSLNTRLIVVLTVLFMYGGFISILGILTLITSIYSNLK